MMDSSLGGDGVELHPTVLCVANQLESKAFGGFTEGYRGYNDESTSFRSHDFHQRQVFKLRHDAGLDGVFAKPYFQSASKSGVFNRK